MGILDGHVYKRKEIVVGGSLAAVAYAYFNDALVLMNEVKTPPPFSFFDRDYNLFNVLEEYNSYDFNTNYGIKKVGMSKRELWEYFIFFLSVAGLAPMADKISTVRVSENELRVATKNSRSARIKFEQLVIFDDENLHGLDPPIRETPEEYEVLDWINVRSGMKHEFDLLTTEDKFVKEAYFYQSDRIDGNHDLKDLVAISYLNKEQLNEVECSDLFVRYKMIDLMKKAGIKGKRNGRDVNDKTKFKYYAIKLEPAKREVRKISRNVYGDTGNIKFCYSSEEDIISSYSESPNSYIKKLRDMQDGKLT